MRAFCQNFQDTVVELDPMISMRRRKGSCRRRFEEGLRFRGQRGLGKYETGKSISIQKRYGAWKKIILPVSIQ